MKLARPIDAAFVGYLLAENKRLRSEADEFREALQDVASNWKCCELCDADALLEDCVLIARDALDNREAT